MLEAHEEDKLDSVKKKPISTQNSQRGTFINRFYQSETLENIGHALRHLELSSTIIEGVMKRKIPSGQPCNKFIKQVKKDARAKSYRH